MQGDVLLDFVLHLGKELVTQTHVQVETGLGQHLQQLNKRRRVKEFQVSEEVAGDLTCHDLHVLHISGLVFADHTVEPVEHMGVVDQAHLALLIFIQVNEVLDCLCT